MRRLYKLQIIALMISGTCHASGYQDATQQAMNAAYKQSGYASLVNAYADELQVRYVPMTAKESGAVVYFIYKIVNDHSVGFKWSF